MVISLPRNLPTLVIVANDNDKYVKSNDLIRWTRFQKGNGVSIYSYQCKEALHDTINEREPIGMEVRRLSTEFATFILRGNWNINSTSQCQRFI
jgi:hypothetical protein